MSLHIYVSRMQPATRVYYADLGIKPFCLRRSRRSLIRCHSCNRVRWAAKIYVQVYGDGDRQSCRDRNECAAWKKAERKRKRLARANRSVDAAKDRAQSAGTKLHNGAA